MNRVLVLIATVLLIFLCMSQANAQNPFTSQGKQEKVSPLLVQSYPFLAKISIWQQRINQKMAALTREAKETQSPKPLLVLFVLAFAYGLLHSAGPGHGKAVAMSYMVSRDSSFRECIMLGNFIALFHGLSGIVLVLVVHRLLQSTVMGSLDSVTRTTQVISYSLITVVGIGLLVKNLYDWKRREEPAISADHAQCAMKRRGGPVSTALFVGMVPCPGVVLIMLFAMSLGLVWLGLLLALMMTLGMAATISAVVIVGVSGKNLLLSTLARKATVVVVVEKILTMAAALMVTILGLTFLLATI